MMETKELLGKLCGECYGCSTRPTNVGELCSNPLEKYMYQRMEEGKIKAHGRGIEDCTDNIHPIIVENARRAGIREVVEYAIRCRSETQGEIKRHPKKTWKLCVDRIIGYAKLKEWNIKLP